MKLNPYELPTILSVNSSKYPIRTDFRDILTIIQALDDPDLDDQSKAYVLLNILYLTEVPDSDIEQALKAGSEFISGGIEESTLPQPKLMDWEQDAPLIMPAINKVAGMEVRSLPYLHWWTFIGYYMEIGEGQFSTVVGIREKKAKGKKLDKEEQEFYRRNRNLVDLKKKISTEDEEALKQLLGEE